MDNFNLIEEIPFQVSARTARLIGRENVSSPENALIELVKNSYDADSSVCIVYIDNISLPGNGNIYIIDNGDGMSEKIIRDYWMTIGTENKQYEPITKSKRVKSGAKGIGRFALDRLGSLSTMYTKPKDSEEGFYWEVNWGSFEQKGINLNDVKAKLYKISNLEIKNIISEQISDKKVFEIINKLDFTNGTILKISNFRKDDNWSDETIEKLNKNFEITAPPNDTFKLYLFAKDKEKFGLVEPSICDDYDYKLVADIKEDGNIEIIIDRNEFVIEKIPKEVFNLKTPKDMSKPPYDYKTLQEREFKFNTTISKLLPGIEKDELIKIGRFNFTFYFLKQSGEKDVKKFFYRAFDVNSRKKWLDNFGGIKLYRDSFRVKPYGERKSDLFDWLKLDQRHSGFRQGPGQKDGKQWKVTSSQVFGIVNISRVFNPYLDDKVGREGIIETKVFSHFKLILISLIHEFELDRHFIMRPMAIIREEKEKIEEKEKNDKIALAEQIIAEKNREDIEIISKGQLIENELPEVKKHKTEKIKLAEGLIENKKEHEKVIQEIEEENRLLRGLASTGLTLTTFTHELTEVKDKIDYHLRKLLEFLKFTFKEEDFRSYTLFQNPFGLIKVLYEKNEHLNNWIERTIKSMAKDRRKIKSINLKKYFSNFVELWKYELNEKKIGFEFKKEINKDIEIRAIPIDLDSIFNNLLINSFDAFLRIDAPSERKIIIDYEIKTGSIEIIYEDTGPGLYLEINDIESIFEPLVSYKRNRQTGEIIGTGLGMWIVQQTIEEYGGYISIERPRPGIKFKLVFNI